MKTDSMPTRIFAFSCYTLCDMLDYLMAYLRTFFYVAFFLFTFWILSDVEAARNFFQGRPTALKTAEARHLLTITLIVSAGILGLRHLVRQLPPPRQTFHPKQNEVLGINEKTVDCS